MEHFCYLITRSFTSLSFSVLFSHILVSLFLIFLSISSFFLFFSFFFLLCFMFALCPLFTLSIILVFFFLFTFIFLFSYSFYEEAFILHPLSFFFFSVLVFVFLIFLSCFAPPSFSHVCISTSHLPTSILLFLPISFYVKCASTLTFHFLLHCLLILLFTPPPPSRFIPLLYLSSRFPLLLFLPCFVPLLIIHFFFLLLFFSFYFYSLFFFQTLPIFHSSLLLSYSTTVFSSSTSFYSSILPCLHSSHFFSLQLSLTCVPTLPNLLPFPLILYFILLPFLFLYSPSPTFLISSFHFFPLHLFL